MKVAFIIDTYDLLTNGTVMTAHRMVEQFRRNGHEMRVIGTGAKGEGCYEVPELYLPLVTEVSAKQQMRFAKADMKVINEALDGVDIVYCYLPFHIEKKVRKIAKKRNLPCVAGFHLHPENITYNIGIHHSGLISNFIFWYFKKSFYHHFDHIHCPSKFIAEQLKRRKFMAKMHVISNGVDPKFIPLDPSEKQPNEMFEILSVGRYADEKRQDIIIKAISLSKYADKIHLTLAGKGPKRKKLEKLAKKYIKNPVTFAFYNSDDLTKVMQHSDLYIHAADVEIEGISCIEAFSCGVVPVIANAKESATPQFAIDKRSLFKARSPKDLASKIDYWIEHPQERYETAVKYAEQGKTKYSLDFMSKKMEEMFNEAIKTHKQKQLPKQKIKKRNNPYRHCLFFRMLSWLWYYIILVPCLYVYIKCILGLKVKGRKNLKQIKKTGAISISNHVHKLDCAFNACALMPKKIIITALNSNFRIPVAGSILKISGVVPVGEKISETRLFMNEMKKTLKKRRLVHFYAEGHLIEYYAGIRELNRGAFVLACEAQVPIIPIVISWRKRKGWFKIFFPSKPCPTITVGEPINPDYLLLKRDQVTKLQEDVVKSMQTIYDNSNNGKNVDYYKDNNITPQEHQFKNEK